MAKSFSRTRFSHQLFTRPAKNGEKIYYVRFTDTQTGQVLATKSTGVSSLKETKPIITSFLSELDLDSLAKMKNSQLAARLSDDERLSNMSVYAFIQWFWSPDSYYLSERADAGRPLSKSYIDDNHHYVEENVKSFEDFSNSPLKYIRLSHVEAFVRKLRRAGKSHFVIQRNIDALRTPINWAKARSLIEIPFEFKTLVLPKKDSRERGILSDDEIGKIVALQYAKTWVADSGKAHFDTRPRPRQKGGILHGGAPMLDIRQKAAILLALFAGLRRGEIRGLRWKDVNLENGYMQVQHNYVRFEGDKTPKKQSTGIVPIAPELEVIIKEVRSLADFLGYTGPDDYVLPGSKRSMPVSETTIVRAWDRALELIGITLEERKERNLVFHGARHSYTTRLLDSGELSSAEVAKLTRHRDLSMLTRYGGHTRDETIQKGRRALSLRKEETPDEKNRD